MTDKRNFHRIETNKRSIRLSNRWRSWKGYIINQSSGGYGLLIPKGKLKLRPNELLDMQVDADRILVEVRNVRETNHGTIVGVMLKEFSSEKQAVVADAGKLAWLMQLSGYHYARNPFVPLVLAISTLAVATYVTSQLAPTELTRKIESVRRQAVRFVMGN